MIFLQVLTWGAAGTRLNPTTPPGLSSTQLASKTGLSPAEICRDGSHCQAQIKYWWLYRYGVEKDSKAQEDALMHETGKAGGDKEHAVINRAEQVIWCFIQLPGTHQVLLNPLKQPVCFCLFVCVCVCVYVCMCL